MRSDRARTRALLLGMALVAGGRAHADEADDAAARVFPPPAVLERETIELTAEQGDSVAAAAGTALPSRTVARFVARGAGDGAAARPLGFAYLDTHLVRTLEETLLVALDPAGRVLRVEVVRFREPREYLPSRRWFAQFEGRALERELALKRGIRSLTGASLSSRAATDAVRRVLALHARLGGATEERR